MEGKGRVWKEDRKVTGKFAVKWIQVKTKGWREFQDGS
jgi:hypothetical protein